MCLQAAYFGAVNYDGGNVWTGPTGGYSGVVRRIGAGAIDWFNVQFYNGEQGLGGWAGVLCTRSIYAATSCRSGVYVLQLVRFLIFHGAPSVLCSFLPLRRLLARLSFRSPRRIRGVRPTPEQR